VVFPLNLAHYGKNPDTINTPIVKVREVRANAGNLPGVIANNKPQCTLSVPSVVILWVTFSACGGLVDQNSGEN
jgi:hypothetical protein